MLVGERLQLLHEVLVKVLDDVDVRLRASRRGQLWAGRASEREEWERTLTQQM